MVISFTGVQQPLHKLAAEAYALFVSEGFNIKECALLQWVPALEAYCAVHNFIGKRGSVLRIPVMHDNTLRYYFIGGLGKSLDGTYDIEAYRRAWGGIVRQAQSMQCKTLAVQLPEAKLFAQAQLVDDAKLLGGSDFYLAAQTAMVGHMAFYVFDEFKKPAPCSTRLQVTLALTGHDKLAVQRGIAQGDIIGSAVNDAREWVNLPANVLRPHDLAARAKHIADEYGLTCEIFGEKEINKMGMGGLAAVSSGSEQECCFVVMQYKTTRKKAPTIGLVGKGITFDSGGLSLKPAAGMEDMKDDMAGAAAVIASMKALAQLKPEINIIAAMPIAENLPSGFAAKPGDIVRMYNGKTVEIKNTDCEGRLILADALAYVVDKYKLDALVDLATLTGACRAALGPFFSGALSEHDELFKKIEHAAAMSGDAVWRMPLTDDYKSTVDCAVADLANTGAPQYFAGTTTGAVFLQHFVGKIPWVHLDIAGTSLNVPDIAYYRPHTATGVGVRLLVALAMHW